MNNCSICHQLEKYIQESQPSIESTRLHLIDVANRLIQYVETHTSENIDFSDLNELHLELDLVRQIFHAFVNEKDSLIRSLQLHRIHVHNAL